MSRTYKRRKYGKGPGKRRYPRWVTHDYVIDESTRHLSYYYCLDRDTGKMKVEYYYKYNYVYREKRGSELDKAISNFHCNYRFRVNPPKWFVKKFLNRPYRAKTKAILRKMVKESYYDDYSFDPVKKCAGYNWW